MQNSMISFFMEKPLTHGFRGMLCLQSKTGRNEQNYPVFESFDRLHQTKKPIQRSRKPFSYSMIFINILSCAL